MSKPTHHHETKHETVPANPFHAAFDKTAKERESLAETDLFPINLDIPLIITTVIGTLPRLTAYRDEIAKELPNFDIARFDKLQPYAEALSHAQTMYLAASEPIEALPDLAQRATQIRDQLLADANVLAKRGLIDGRRLTELKGGPGYLNIGSDISVLAQLLRERWKDISSKTAIQESELEEAEKVHVRITFAYAQRSHESVSSNAATVDRQRAYTLLVKTYDQARRAVLYLRWDEGDGDRIAPSLWAGRGGRGSNSNASTTTPAAGNPTPAPADAAPKAPAPTANDNGHDGAAHPAAAGGLPGGSPFGAS